MVPVGWLLNNIENSVDGFEIPGRLGVDWQAMIEQKSFDADFWPLVGTIINYGFRVPIVVRKDVDGWNYQLGNGHHRLTAAILLGLDEIPVYCPRLQEGYMCLDKSDTETLDYDSEEWERPEEHFEWFE